MQASVKVFYNTGFNGIDIPASPTVLMGAQSKTYTGDIYYVREDIDKPSIRLKDSYENLSSVDYCAITTSRGTCYYFAVPTALSKGVTLLTLDLDALLTMGGAANLNYISGWQERGHIAKADDDLFANVAAEDWRPSQPLLTKNMTTLKMTSQVQDDLDVVISNIDIGALGADGGLDEQTVVEGINGDGDVVMYFPSIKAPQTHTSFYMYDYDQQRLMFFTIPNTAAYNAGSATVRQGLQKLYSCGQLQLQASYKIPKEYVSSFVAASDGRYTSITGGYANKQLNDLPFAYTEGGYTPKNKKVYATFRTYSLVNVGSGDMIVKSPEDIYNGSAQPSVNLWADMCSTGKPYARFSYIKGSPIQFSDCVRGLQWANSQLVMEGASGSLWNSIDNAYANRSAESEKAFSTYARQIGMRGTELSAAQAKMNTVTGGIGSAVSGALKGLAGGTGGAVAGAAASVAQSQANYQLNLMGIQNQEDLAAGQYALQQRQIEQHINQNNLGLIRSNNVVAPTVSFTPEQNLGLYGYNYFAVYETRKSLDDLKSEDMYYQKYGYNGLHRTLTAQCFNEREYYCFVQAFDVNLKGVSDFGMQVRTKAISQLNGGVRVWKVLPDSSYYELN